MNENQYSTSITPFGGHSAVSGRAVAAAPGSIGCAEPTGTPRGRANRLSPPCNTHDALETILHKPRETLFGAVAGAHAAAATKRAPLTASHHAHALQARRLHALHGWLAARAVLVRPATRRLVAREPSGTARAVELAELPGRRGGRLLAGTARHARGLSTLERPAEPRNTERCPHHGAAPDCSAWRPSAPAVVVRRPAVVVRGSRALDASIPRREGLSWYT